MTDNAKPFRLNQQSIDNLNIAPSLSKEYPETGYNFQDTAFLANQLCQTHDNCAFVDTKEVLLSETNDDMYKYIKNSINGKSNVVTGEIFVNKGSEMLMLAPILKNAVIGGAEKIVCPLNLTYPPKESHAVALCVYINDDGVCSAVILEQHAQNKAKDKEAYKHELDYSGEISEVLGKVSSFFGSYDITVNTKYNEKPICREEKVCGIVSMEACKRLLEAENPVALVEEGFSLTADDVKKLHNQNVQNYIVDTIAEKIINGLPEWNHSSAKNDSEIQKTKDLFLQKMNNIKEKSITDETVVLRTIDYCIAKYVPDEHVSLRIQGENQRAGTEIIAKDEALAYKIPPSENNNLATLNNEKFAESQLFTLVAPSDENEKSNILVATKEQNGKRVGIVAIDSFMIEMGNEQTREQVGKIADYVLQQSQNWDNIIFDFRGNGGGDSTIIKEIGERLSAKKLEYADKIEVINKELDEPTGAPDFYPQKPTDKTFTGNIYVLQDGGNASATEGAIWMLRQMDNCTTIGENTHGAFAGGDVKRHQISDNVVLRLGNTYRERTMPNGQKVHEGKGIPADIKCSSSKAYEKALTCIKDKHIERINELRGYGKTIQPVKVSPPIQIKQIDAGKLKLYNNSTSKGK